MGSELQIFGFNGFEVRTVVIEDKPYFVLKDVCDILELKNATMVANRLDEDEVTKFNLGGLSGESNVINESGLYKTIFQSKKEVAKKFTKWVTSEVLPTIRKTSRYEIPKDPMSALKLMFEAQTETIAKVEVIEDQVVELTENARLDAGEYNYLSSRVSERVKDIKSGMNIDFNVKQNREIFKAINSDVKKITGIDTRSQLKRKNYHDVLMFVNMWYPSQATIIKIKQLSLGGE